MRRDRSAPRAVAAALALLLAGCSSAGDDSWLGGSWFGGSWFGPDEPESSAVAMPPPDPASVAALDTTAATGDPVQAAQEPTLAETETAILPDAPAPEIAAAAAAPSEPAAIVPGDPSIIAVRYSGERAPDVVRLVTPDGTSLEPVEIAQVTTEVAHDDGWPNIQVGVTGGSSSDVQTGVNIGFPIFGEETPNRPPNVRTQAQFRLPDIEDYREHWQQYRVVMLFQPGTPEEERIEMLPPHPDAMLP
jgi:hypothetical protein